MTNRPSALTPRQLQVLQIVRDYQKSQCYSITLQELAQKLGLSRTTIFEHVGGLKEKGLLSADPGRARSLKLTRQGQRLLEQNRQYHQNDSSDDNGIPLLGRVAAGVPIEAIQNAEQISLRSEFGSGDDVFALTVCGDSMTGDGIYDGDTVICKQKQNASQGEIVVAIVDDENATVKRFYREKDCVRLEASNENYEPIYTENCRIAGVVTGLMRKLGN
ncbi:MAG: transcriptional repressor LexA [Anaerohalosphaeraceae bacterium]|nr:transcriptional repressor LexA [Anaerohalosphaeraceae bacterium]